jgi:predicted nucleic acid-binding protein
VHHQPAITFVTVGELLVWTFRKHFPPPLLDRVQGFIDDSRILGYDPVVARRWGMLQGRARLRGRPRPDNDTWIAACCLQRGLPLATFNTKDVQDYADHDGLVLVA